jgi:hypothetical protein
MPQDTTPVKHFFNRLLGAAGGPGSETPAWPPRPPAAAPVIAALAAANTGRRLSEETRRKMSAAHRRRGTRPPKAGRPWSAAEDALLPGLPAAEVARRTGRTLGAAYARRRDLAAPGKHKGPGDALPGASWLRGYRLSAARRRPTAGPCHL